MLWWRSNGQHAERGARCRRQGLAAGGFETVGGLSLFLPTRAHYFANPSLETFERIYGMIERREPITGPRVGLNVVEPHAPIPPDRGFSLRAPS